MNLPMAQPSEPKPISYQFQLMRDGETLNETTFSAVATLPVDVKNWRERVITPEIALKEGFELQLLQGVRNDVINLSVSYFEPSWTEKTPLQNVKQSQRTFRSQIVLLNGATFCNDLVGGDTPVKFCLSQVALN